ncbi:uncharacterized protein LOC122398464 [Colletes gigas]|uniref:uncharacterized protein LOC122398464 n=1 Tax=Colletes gigas TaxID=935657 RepID=UPI001C9AE987|nr:uncharacterized protein LOC122398464 [Colletes gigas]
MKKSVLLFSIVSLAMALVGAKPVPESKQNDLEYLAPQESRYPPYAFWFGRPYYELNDDDGDYTYFNRKSKRPTSTVSYANVGAGWGR